MKKSIRYRVKIFVWDHFVQRFYGDWLDEYAQELSYNNEPDHENMIYDLD